MKDPAADNNRNFRLKLAAKVPSKTESFIVGSPSAYRFYGWSTDLQGSTYWCWAGLCWGTHVAQLKLGLRQQNKLWVVACLLVFCGRIWMICATRIELAPRYSRCHVSTAGDNHCAMLLIRLLSVPRSLNVQIKITHYNVAYLWLWVCGSKSSTPGIHPINEKTCLCWDVHQPLFFGWLVLTHDHICRIIPL